MKNQHHRRRNDRLPQIITTMAVVANILHIRPIFTVLVKDLDSMQVAGRLPDFLMQ